MGQHSGISGGRTLKLLLLDNYDSFTFNLLDLLQAAARDLGLALEVRVVRNDAQSLDELKLWLPDCVVLSPGPNTPDVAGICLELLQKWLGQLPIFGVCLGHQALAVALGGRLARAPRPTHGKQGTIAHDNAAIYGEMPQDFLAMRYHSLIVDEQTLPADLQVTSRLHCPEDVAEHGLIMGLRHRRWPAETVQFHPESVGTPLAAQLGRGIVNWLMQQRTAGEIH